MKCWLLMGIALGTLAPGALFAAPNRYPDAPVPDRRAPIPPGLSPAQKGPELATRALLPSVVPNADTEVLRLINRERARYGRSPLALSLPLTRAARSHAAWMSTAKFYGHDSADGPALARLMAVGLPVRAVWGEAIAAQLGSARSLVVHLLATKKTRDQLLWQKFTHLGVGGVQLKGSPYGTYWTLEFTDRAPVALSPARSRP